MRSLAIVVLAGLFALLAVAAERPGTVGRRMALVVGNDGYKALPSLRKARVDARAVAAALKRSGFDVALHLDVDQRGFKAALRTFKASLESGDDVVFYYAGHGVELGGANYLLPVDLEKGSDEDQLRDDGIRLQRVLDDLRDQRVRFSLVIVDACRDNPFRADGRGIPSRGLAATTPATGQMVIYSAGAGQSALDDLGDADKDPNGLFVRVLLKEIDKPGMPADKLARRLRDEVARLAESVHHEQVPALYDQSRGEFYFRLSDAMSPASENGASRATGTSPSARTPESIEDELWRAIEGSRDPADFEDYQRRYPNGRYVALADVKLRALRRDATPAPSVSPQAPLPSSARALRAFRDCADCPEMVTIPAGSFSMGSPPDEDGRWEAEGPVHPVSLSREFALSRLAVTFDQWDACVRGGGCGGYRPPDRGWGRGSRPVVYVAWHDALAYANWLSKRTGRAYRLPSEAEWEYAARAGTSGARYWGDVLPSRIANCATCGTAWDNLQTAPGGSFGANPFGLHDMLGNAWQWTQDCWNYSYAGTPRDGSAASTGHCELRATRGGAYLNEYRMLRAASRSPSLATERRAWLGFRVARSLP